MVDGCIQTVEKIKLCFWKISKRNYRRGEDGILNDKVYLLSKNPIYIPQCLSVRPSVRPFVRIRKKVKSC